MRNQEEKIEFPKIVHRSSASINGENPQKWFHFTCFMYSQEDVYNNCNHKHGKSIRENSSLLDLWRQALTDPSLSLMCLFSGCANLIFNPMISTIAFDFSFTLLKQVVMSAVQLVSQNCENTIPSRPTSRTETPNNLDNFSKI